MKVSVGDVLATHVQMVLVDGEIISYVISFDEDAGEVVSYDIDPIYEMETLDQTDRGLEKRIHKGKVSVVWDTPDGLSPELYRELSEIPKLALSVRQPWAWAIIHAGKDIENRSWQAVNHGLKIRGRVAIHASKGMTQSEYYDTANFMRGLGIECPLAADLLYGGIIGSVEVVDVVKESTSPWFFGPRGLVLANPIACKFIPAVGALGYFKWKKASRDIIPETKPWMLKQADSHDPLGPLL